MSTVSNLQRIDVGFALVGGIAVSVRAEPRFTRDADFAMAVSTDSEAEHITFQMQRLGYRAAGPGGAFAPGLVLVLRSLSPPAQRHRLLDPQAPRRAWAQLRGHRRQLSVPHGARHARSAVGMYALPSNIAVEVEMIVELEN